MTDAHPLPASTDAHEVVAAYWAAAQAADDGKTALITDFWPEPCELPASRAQLVERC